MKILYSFVLILFLTHWTQAQNPSFNSQPALQGGFVCYGSTATINATTANADTYQLEIQDGNTGSWSDYGGVSGSATSGSISIALPNYTLSNNYRIRLDNINGLQYSNEFFVDAQRPQFTVQPQNQIQCYDEDVSFYTNAGFATYTWEKSDGGAFTSSLGARHSGGSTNILSVTDLNTANHLYNYRVKVTDAQGCENTSQAASLFVNYMSTIRPTTGTEFCEGESGTFSATLTGTASSFEWTFEDASNNSLSPTLSTNTDDEVTVSKIPGGLNEVFLTVQYNATIMNANGTVSNITCEYGRSRSGYTVNARPDAPIIAGDSVCGSGTMTLNIDETSRGTYNWHADSTASSLAEGESYDTPSLSTTTKYFVNVTDAEDCPSDFTEVIAKVNPLPSATVGSVSAICPSENTFTIPLSSITAADSFSISLSSGTLAGFVSQSGFISGANLSISLPSAKNSGDYTFSLVLYNTTSRCESLPYSIPLRVKENTIFTTDISSLRICEGENLNLTSLATGEGTVTYAWYKDSGLLTSETSSDLTIAEIELSEAGTYQVRATAECGTINSSSAVVTVNPKTKISSQPQNVEVCEGANASFSVTATGHGTLSYQWKKDGVNIGTNAATLELENLSSSDHNAKITCVVSGDCGDSTSAEAIITVNALPLAPVVSDTAFCQNSTAGPIEAEALTNHTLNWYGTDASGGTASSTAPTPPTNGTSTLSYYVSQSGPENCESSRAKIEVSFTPALTVSVSSSESQVCQYGVLNSTIFFTANPLGGTGTYTYQWGKGTEDIAGATNKEYTGDGAGTYYVKVKSSNCEGQQSVNITSIGQSLSNAPSAAISGENVPYEFCEGESVTINGTAQNTETGTELKWYASPNATVSLVTGNSYEVLNIGASQTVYLTETKTFGLISCETDRTPVELSVNEAPSVSTSITNESCESANDGAFELTPGTSNIPYSFKLNDVSFGTVSSFTGLDSGTYTVTLQDANSCTATANVVVGSEPLPSFSTQPTDQTNCKGNVVYFEAIPADINLARQWQIKLPEGTWQNITGETDTELRVGSIGNSSNPEGTNYRMLLGTGTCQNMSDEAELFVNEFTENLDNQTACEGDLVTFEPPSPTGNITNYEWQKRVGTSGPWDIANSGSTANYVINSASLSDDDTYYRVKLTFSNPGGGTCVETSDQGKLDVIEVTETTLSGTAEICSGETTQLTATGCNGTVTWSDSQTGNIISVNPTVTTTYSAKCENEGCEKTAINSIVITVKPGLAKPLITATKTELCFGETAELTLTGCSGSILWSTNETSSQISVQPTASTKYSAECSQNGCTSPPADSVTIIGYPELQAGQISGTTEVNCSGYNPPTIQSTTDPSGGKGELTVSWEMSESCDGSDIVWSTIDGESGNTFNPSTLSKTTCYRRKVIDECGAEKYSNVVTIQIVDDPEVTVTASADSVCSASPFTLTAAISGGTGTCTTTWQQNLKSGASGSSFWEDISGSDFTNVITGVSNSETTHATIYYRAIYDCDLTNCNKATSESVAVVIAPQVALSVLSDKTEICEEEVVKITASGCNGTLTWNNGQTGSTFDYSPYETGYLIGTCLVKGCDVSVKDSVKITVNPGISAPGITATKDQICFGDSSVLTAGFCASDLLWSTGETSTSIIVKPTDAQTYTVVCKNTECSSPVSETTVIGSPELVPGDLVEFTAVNCDGYNPSTIQSNTDPSGGKGVLTVSWEMSESCEGSEIVWSTIDGESGSTFNPSTLSKTTCYRRKVTDECGAEKYSNVVTIQIVDDPEVTVTASADSVCSASPFTLTASISGGTGTCTTTWQQNLKSGASGSSFWEDISGTDFTNVVTGVSNSETTHATIYYRAIYDCDLTNCNKATSESVALVIRPSNEVKLNVSSDTTICAGNPINLVASSCGGTVSWNDGSTESSRTVYPSSDLTYTVTCSGACGTFTASTTVKVLEGLPAPVSTTPISAIQPDTLFFSASGSNLTWYFADHADSTLASAPKAFEVGDYTYWVSQSDDKCVSPRTKVFGTVYPKLALTAELYDQYDCEGNSVNFQVKAEGAGDLVYRWQRKRPGETEFTNVSDEDDGIKNAQQATLRVSAVGDKDNPHLSQYRCIVGDSVSILYTDPRTLYANVVNRTLPNLDACVGQDFEIDLFGFLEIIGDVKGYQWQVRDDQEKEWVDLENDGFITGVNTSKLSFTNLQPWHSRKYRCSILFNTGGFECTENTDQTELSVGEYPQRPPDLSVDYCQGETTRSLSYNAKPFDDRWYLSNNDEDLGMTRQPKVSSDTAGTFIWYFAAESDEGCASEKAKYTITIHPEPDAPQNTTPPTVFEGDTLTFTAKGENLTWYLSRTGKSFEPQSPPRFTEVDVYDFWVSQTSEFECESPRTYVVSEIIGTLGFKEPLESLADCEGNSVRFISEPKGFRPFTFKWQKRLPGDSLFVDIPDEFEEDLLVSNIGSSENPHLTEYRVILTDSTGDSTISNPAILTVNEVSGVISEQVYCQGSDFKVDTSGLVIIGKLRSVELQKQNGRSWKTLAESVDFNFGRVSSDSLATGDFRLRFVLAGERGGTCSRSSPEFSIRVSPAPEKPGRLEQTICQYGMPDLPVLRAFTYNWYDQDTVAINKQSLSFTSGVDLFYLYSWEDIHGCESAIDSVILTVLPAPPNILEDSTYSLCGLDSLEQLQLPDSLEFNIYTDSLLTQKLVDSSFSRSDSVMTLYVTMQLDSICQSQPVKMNLILNDCYLGIEERECDVVASKEVSGNGWEHIRNENGDIVLSINAEEQDLGKVEISLKQQGVEPIMTSGGTAYLPRYYHISAGNETLDSLEVRVYFTREEVEEYLASVNSAEQNDGLYQIVSYTGNNADCSLDNNDNFSNGESWVIAKDQQIEDINTEFVSFTFKMINGSEIGITSNPFAELNTLEVETVATAANLSWKANRSIRTSQILIEKSRDDNEWIFVANLSANIREHVDYFPYEGNSSYRIVSIDWDGTRKVLAQQAYYYASGGPSCFTYPNPSRAGSAVNLYHRDIEPKSIQLFDMAGMQVPVSLSQNSPNTQKMHFLSDMKEGVYILRIRGENQKHCEWKLIRQNLN
ncbi:Ig-like domain-containing protein [Jiulongibacter sp. NS-SX5]|uniref:Ig-like domain-containing protein n=1 Tax=Jiulongibacter sp. NS-SX5 TaxID=3463854 RepID=UPI004058C621